MKEVLNTIESVLFVSLAVLFAIVFAGPVLTTVWVWILGKIQKNGDDAKGSDE